MDQSSTRFIGEGFSFAKARIRELSAVFFLFYVPVQILKFVFHQRTFGFLPNVLGAIIDTVLFGFLFGVFSVAVVGITLRGRKENTGRRASILSSLKSIPWVPGLLANSIPVLSLLPQSIIAAAWPSPNPTVTMGGFIAALIGIAVHFSAFMIVPAAMSGRIGPLAAWRLSWHRVRQNLDTAIVVMILLIFLRFLLSVPVLVYHFGRALHASPPVPLALELVLAVPFVIGVVIQMIVATDFFRLLDRPA